jgi:hypothetical protein
MQTKTPPPASPNDLFGTPEFRRRQGNVSPMTQHRREKAGILPPPDVRINGRKYWREETYANWIAAQAEAEDVRRESIGAET